MASTTEFDGAAARGATQAFARVLATVLSVIALCAFGPGLAGAQPAAGGLPVADETIDDIVVGSRILAEFGVLDAFGHVSARDPAHPERFLMSRSLAPALVTAADIMAFDLEGSALEPRGRAVFLERYIHAEIYRARPDVMAVVHTHSAGVVAFAATKVPLRPMYHNAAFLGAGAPVWDIRADFGDATDMLVRTAPIGRSLARALGDRSIVLMRGHGDVTVGPAVKVAVFRAYYADVNARLQTQALTLGGEVTYLSKDESIQADLANQVLVDRVWNLWKLRIAQPSAK